MKRHYAMRFGADFISPSETQFRLWAPAAKSVALRFENSSSNSTLAMEREQDGWWSRTAPAPPGTRYRYMIDDEVRVPDPASRFQPDDVHGPSEVVDPAAYRWRDTGWHGRPWHEVILYELHVGTFTAAGNYRGVIERLDHLKALGATAIELMPVADWPGARNWGYDGVYLFAPDSRYGRPEELKTLVDEAHARGLMVFLDVVYNHFGPEGNYLHRYAPSFFTEKYATPWGAAINFEDAASRPVRDFFIANAIFWLEEYHFDGLRLDAVHAIYDTSRPHFLVELARRVRATIGEERHVHLVLENYDNAARFLSRAPTGRPLHFDAQWNDDFHHAIHVALTEENEGYYADFADEPRKRLGRSLAECFAYQGEISAFAGNVPRGEPSRDLPPTAVVSMVQNHDQVGNRAFGERITDLVPAEAVRAAVAIMLLAPAPPMLFMGEEWAAPSPFLFFCDFGRDLADAVRDGRRREFERFPQFKDESERVKIPDPMSEETFRRSVLDWSALGDRRHKDWLEYYRRLLKIRHAEIVPRIANLKTSDARYETFGNGGLQVVWRLADGSRLWMGANLSVRRETSPPLLPGRPLFANDDASSGPMSPWSVRWHLEEVPAR